MKLHLIIATVVILLGCMQPDAAWASTNSLASIRTIFATNATLATNDLEAVVKLANLCGMSEVAEVKTFHIGRMVYHAILVTGPEKVDGRKITFQTLEVQREGWSYKAKPAGRPFVNSVGQFWVEELQPLESHELTTFATAKGNVRVSFKTGISIDIADKIIFTLKISAFRVVNFLHFHPG
jgi:hypothetical protein